MSVATGAGSASRIVLLGPQRRAPGLASHLDALDLRGGPVLSITAGWQEWEGDAERLSHHVGFSVTDLALHARAERIFAEDPALFAVHRERQDRLIALQRLYRLRLSHMLASIRELQGAGGPADLREDAIRSAIGAARALDRYHLRQVRRVHEAFSEARARDDHPALERERTCLSEQLAGAGAVLVAGGHVAVLANRLRLFALEAVLGTCPVLAWSAGAMVLCPRIVLFHDHPPQGRGDPEVLDLGLGLVPGVVSLPDAATRLDLDDPTRVAGFARRFAPEACVTLDPGAALTFEQGAIASARSVSRLTRDGRLAGVGPQ